MTTYRPLPDFLEIRESSIEGQGLFSRTVIESNINLGVSHVRNINFENDRIRTPLGGFVNHSDNPNCHFMRVGDCWYMYTLNDIMPDEELTVMYSLYSVKN